MRQAILDAIREQRRDRRTLADFLGVTQATLSRYISGEIDPPTSKALRLALLLNRPVEQLFADLLRPARGGDGLARTRKRPGA